MAAENTAAVVVGDAVCPASAPAQPPGPRGWPYFGCLNGLLRNPMGFWLGIAERYGGIARVPLKGGRHVYHIADPELLYELLVTKRKKYRKNTRYRAAVEVLGEGLLLTEGDAWKRQRLITQPAFKPEYLREQVPWMAAYVDGRLDRWAGIADTDTELDTESEFFDLSQRIAGRYLMGPGFERIADRFCDAGLRIRNAWPLPPRSVFHALLGRSTGWNEALAEPLAEINACTQEYLASARRDDFADCGLLTTLVHGSRAQGDEFDDASLRSQLMTLFFAGHETSATSLVWIHYLLDRHPEVRDAVRAEARQVLGERMPSAAEVDRLHYTERVISEALRLYSPIHSISRVALEDDTIGDYAIAKGSMIYVSLYAMHRRSALWPDPHRFDPDRFTPERSAGRPRFAFIPFAAGHRNCIGLSMAMVELKLAVAQIARRYTLDVVPGQRIEGAAGTTMRPRDGMRVRLSTHTESPA